MQSERLFDKQHFRYVLSLHGYTFEGARLRPKSIDMDNYQRALDATQLPQSTKCELKVISAGECKAIATFQDESAISFRQFMAQCKQDLETGDLLQEIYVKYRVPKDFQSLLSKYVPLITREKCERLILEIILNTNVSAFKPISQGIFYIGAPLDQLLMFKLLPNREIDGVQILNIANFDNAIDLSEADKQMMAPEIMISGKCDLTSDIWEIGNIIATLQREKCLTTQSEEFWNKIVNDCTITDRKNRAHARDVLVRVLVHLSKNVNEEDLENIKSKQLFEMVENLLYKNAGKEKALMSKK